MQLIFKIESYAGRLRTKALGNALAVVPGVEAVEIHTRKHMVTVTGKALPMAVMAAATALGYTLTLIASQE